LFNEPKPWSAGYSDGSTFSVPFLGEELQMFEKYMDVKGLVLKVVERAPNLPRKVYTGVGSRNTPREVQERMGQIASVLEDMGYTLRTGDADGADAAFRNGVKDPDNMKVYIANDVNERALELGEKYHPAWERVGSYGRKLHARNSFQILGDNLEDPRPSLFVICWTPDGCTSDEERAIGTGGTGQAISIADDYNVPVYNLNSNSDL